MKGTTEGCGCFPTGKYYAGIAHLVRIQAIGMVEGFEAEHPWAELPVAVIDLETTGRDSVADRIVEIGVVIGKGGEVIARHSWLCNPGCPIPEEARNVHGISDEMVQDQPSFAQIAAEVVRILGGVIPAAYNASFDRSFLMAELGRAGFDIDSLPASLRSSVEWFDPLVWARELHQLEKSRTLVEVSARLGIALETAHRATDDAEAALRCMYVFASDVRVPKSYASFTQEQRRLLRLQDDERSRWRSNRPLS